MHNRELPIEGTRLEKAEGVLDDKYVNPDERSFTDDVDEAHMVTSLVRTGAWNVRHKVVLDLDLPAKLVPSSTEGHFHLFIDKEVPYSAYMDLLKALGRAGLLEEGYVSASLERGYTAVRLPWIKKLAKPDVPLFPEEIPCPL